MRTAAVVDERDQSSEPRADREDEWVPRVVLAVIFVVAAAEVIALCVLLFLR